MPKSKFKNTACSGFTLVELLMTIMVIGILSTIAIGQFVDFGKDAKKAVTLERMMALKSAIVGDPRFVSAGQFTNGGFEAHCLAPPTVLTDLTSIPGAGTCSVVFDPFQKRGWRGPYVNATDSSWNKDAWGTPLQYFVVGPPVRTLRSCGADLVCGNLDDLNVAF